MSDIKIVIGADVGQATAGLSKLNTSLVSFKNTSGQATQAMVNLGRVVQDAPYGFIGIANNLNPLLESFQRLKVETGSTKAAFASLASSLAGPAGLGFAVSIATSLLTVFAQRALQNSGNEAEKAAKKIKSYGEILDQVVSGLAKERVEVQSLVAVLQNETETRDRKLAAIEKLQEMQPEIFKNLSLENNAVKGLDESYKAYLATIQNVIQVKILQAQLEQKIERQLALQTALGNKKLVTDIADLKNQKQLTEAQLSAADAAKKLADNSLLLGFGIKRLQGQKELTQLTSDIDALGKKLFELSSSIRIKVPEVKISPDKVSIEPAKDPRFYANSLRNLFKDIEDKEFKLKINVNAQPEIKIDAAGINKAGILLADQLAKAFTEITNNTLNDAISSLADGIGKALGGNGKFKNIFSGLYNVLGAGLKELGKYLVKTYALIKAIEEIKFKNAAVGIAVGVALQILGATIQSRVQSQNAFATGVRNFGGGLATVGERGPETIFLPRGSSVQPNNEMLAYGGGGVTLQPSLSYDGTRFRIFLDRVDQQMGRNN